MDSLRFVCRLNKVLDTQLFKSWSLIIVIKTLKAALLQSMRTYQQESMEGGRMYYWLELPSQNTTDEVT